MAQNLTQPSPYEDEIDLKEIFKILIESKKLIISTILFFSIASIIYSFSLKPEFKSSAILEIGYSEKPYGTQESIEKPSDLISNLTLYQFLNFQDENQVVSFQTIENKLILIETTSSLAEKNENLLTELINYIDERHSNLTASKTNKKKNEISLKIELIKSEISFYRLQNLLKLSDIKSDISLLKENMQLDFEAEILKLENELPFLEQEISQLEQVLIEDSNNLNLLKGTSLSLERAASSPTLEQIISSYKSKINQLKRDRNNSLSEINILSKKLDALKKNTLQSPDLFILEERRRALENFTSQSEKLFRLEQEQKTLENEFQTLISQTQVKTNFINDITTISLKPQKIKIILIGLIFGFFSSIFLVTIIKFISSFKEN